MIKRLTQSRVKTVLRYFPYTGKFKWLARKVRRGHEKTDKWWNTKWAGKEAGTLKEGYIQIYIDGKPYRAARLANFIMTGRWPKHDADHRDLKRSNDKWKNIRPATRSQNHANKRNRRDNTSGFKGISWHPKNKNWRARFRNKYLGSFKTREQAAKVYRKEATKHFGKFARF